MFIGWNERAQAMRKKIWITVFTISAVAIIGEVALRLDGIRLWKFGVIHAVTTLRHRNSDDQETEKGFYVASDFYLDETYDRNGICTRYRYLTNGMWEGKMIDTHMLDDGYRTSFRYFQHSCAVGDQITRWPNGNIQSIKRYPTNDISIGEAKGIRNSWRHPISAHYYTRQGELCGFTTNGFGVEASFSTTGKGLLNGFKVMRGQNVHAEFNWLTEDEQKKFNMISMEKAIQRGQYLSLEQGVPFPTTVYNNDLRIEVSPSSSALVSPSSATVYRGSRTEKEKMREEAFLKASLPCYVPIIEKGVLFYKYAYIYTNGVVYGRHVAEGELKLAENQPVDLSAWIPELKHVTVYPRMDDFMPTKGKNEATNKEAMP